MSDTADAVFGLGAIAWFVTVGASLTLRSGDAMQGRLRDVLDWARARPPFAAPDSGRAHYSDTNFQLLGAVVEAAYDTSYAEAVTAPSDVGQILRVRNRAAPTGPRRIAAHQPAERGDQKPRGE